MLLILLLKYLLAKATKENHCLPVQRLYGKKQKLSDLRAFVSGIFSITFSCCDAEGYFAAVSMHHLQNSSNFSSAPSPFATQSQEKCMIQTDKFATVRLSNDLEVFKVARVHGSLGEDKSWLTQACCDPIRCHKDCAFRNSTVLCPKQTHRHNYWKEMCCNHS